MEKDNFFPPYLTSPDRMLENMSQTFSMSLLSFCLLLQIFQAKCSTSLAPALYILGDSLADSGNNDFLNTTAKVNFKPYGVDFPDGPTGRFTNGKTSVDFIAEYLGLPLVPPYLGLSVDQKSKTTTGMNYASGSAGILPETGSAMGTNIPLQKQILLFKETVHHYLPKNFKIKEELLEHLSKSIFVVIIGSNDYLNNYLLPEQYSSSHIYTPEQFAIILLKELKQHLQEIYNLGARKFVVFNLAPLGCVPAMKELEKVTIGCANLVNHLVSHYNKGFSSMIEEMRSSLTGSTFVQGDISLFISIYGLSQNPSKYGFITTKPCCSRNNETNLCLKDVPPCIGRITHLYWDGFHPTQLVHFLLAVGCFYGPFPCTPINVQQLAMKQPGTTASQ